MTNLNNNELSARTNLHNFFHARYLYFHRPKHPPSA